MTHLLVTNDFPPKVGGIQAYLWELWRRLDPSTYVVLTASSDRRAAAFDAEQARAGVRAIDDALGGLDVMVHCVGINDRRPVEDYAPADWERIMAVNAGSAFHTATAAAVSMRERRSGRIVFFSSVAGRSGHRLHGQIDAFKAGQLKGAPQPSHRKCLVLGRLRADKTHRAPHHRIADLASELALGVQAQIGQDARNQVFEAEMAAKNLRPGQVAAAQVALQRLDQPALLFGVEIMLDRRGASPAPDAHMAGLTHPFEIQHRPERLGFSAAPGKAHQVYA